MKDQRLDNLLKKVGLRKEMHEGSSDQIFDPNLFTRYFIRYPKTDQMREMDEIYRMSDTWVLHKATGLRLEFSIHETYVGDTYKCTKTFVITKDGNEVSVLDIDLEAGSFITKDGAIPFSEAEMKFSGLEEESSY